MWYSAAKQRCVHDAVLYLHFLCCYWTKPWKMLSIYKLPRERDNVRGNWSSSSPEETLTLLSTYISNTQWMCVSFSVLKLAFTKYLAFVWWNLCHYLKVSSHTYLCLYNSHRMLLSFLQIHLLQHGELKWLLQDSTMEMLGALTCFSL